MKIDRTKLKLEFKDAPYIDGLEGFMQALYKAKPLCDYVVDDNCIITTRMVDSLSGTVSQRYTIRRAKVIENGEEVGAIGVTTRYRGRSSEPVYEIQSFRIRKERGNREAVQAKDLKVALRVAKKTLVSRVDDELKELIGNSIGSSVSSLHASAKNQVRWDFSQEEEIVSMAMLGYMARLNNEKSISLPSTAVSLAGKDMKKHDDKCERFRHWADLKLALDTKQGYGIMVKADKSLVMYSLAQDTITHCKSFEDLTPSIQEKFAMFKVLDENEGYGHIGCKFKEGMFFIAP